MDNLKLHNAIIASLFDFQRPLPSTKLPPESKFSIRRGGVAYYDIKILSISEMYILLPSAKFAPITKYLQLGCELKSVCDLTSLAYVEHVSQVPFLGLASSGARSQNWVLATPLPF